MTVMNIRFQSLGVKTKGFQFTFSAASFANFTEPVTLPRDRSLSVEVIKSIGSDGSQADYIPSPPMTNYESLSACSVVDEADADPNESLSESGKHSLLSVTSLKTPLSSAKGSQQSLASADAFPIAESSNSALVNSHDSNLKASWKRTSAERTTSTPPVSPKKKKSKISSAIRTALERSPKGLMKFLKKCTPAERNEQLRQATEEEDERWEGQEEKKRLKTFKRNEKI
jgi:hypothetical protein